MLIYQHDVLNAKGDVIARHFFDTAPTNQIQHPTQAGVTITPAEFVAMLNADPAMREKGGWHSAGALKGEAGGMTLWDRLVEHTRSDNGDSSLKTINLKGTDAYEQSILDKDSA